MNTEPDRVPARLGADPLELAAELPLTADEAGYVAAARAPNTLRGYRSDWAEFTIWCAHRRLDPLPAARCPLPRPPSAATSPSWPAPARRSAP